MNAHQPPPEEPAPLLQIPFPSSLVPLGQVQASLRLRVARRVLWEVVLRPDPELSQQEIQDVRETDDPHRTLRRHPRLATLSLGDRHLTRTRKAVTYLCVVAGMTQPVEVPEDEFRLAVSRSRSLSEALHLLDRPRVGPTYEWCRRKLTDWGCDTSHWRKPGGTSHIRPLLSLLVERSPAHGANLKSRLLLAGLLRNACYECGISSWRGRVLSLQLDHINGVRDDNRVHNLRLLCPNCHSQTDTFCGRNKRSRRVLTEEMCPDIPKAATKPSCLTCGVEVKAEGRRCRSCAAQRQPTKITWPSSEDLRARVEATSILAVARTLGVSDNAVRKHLGR